MTCPRAQRIKVLSQPSEPQPHSCARCGKPRPEGGCPHKSGQVKGDHQSAEVNSEPASPLQPAVVHRRLIPISEHSAPACTGPHCLNLNVQLEHQRLQQGLALLGRQEKSLLRYLASTPGETLEPFALSLLLDPVFDQIEQVYGTADVLRRHAAKNPMEHGAPCPLTALIEDLEQRIRVYSRMTSTQKGVDPGLTALFKQEDFSRAQIVEPLSVAG